MAISDTIVDNLSLAVTDEVLDYILDESYDPVYGVRTIKRWLEKKVVTEISRVLIGEEIDENSTVYIDARLNGSELVYRVEKNGGLVNVVDHRSEVLCVDPSFQGATVDRCSPGSDEDED